MVPGHTTTLPQRRRLLAAGAIVAGLGLLTVAAVVLWQAAHAPPVYRYIVGEPLADEQLGPLAALAEQDIPVREASVEAADGTRLATLEIAETGAGPVLVNWRPEIDGPFLQTRPTADEFADLAPVLDRHMPANATLLAWWDSSRAFRLFTEIDVAFGDHLGVPLFVPARWEGARGRIETTESKFWQAPGDLSDERARFQRFVDALLADERRGMAALRELAGDRPAVLVLHVRDIILLGQLAPETIGVAFQDFPASGNVHGMVRSAHGWLNEHGYSAYTLMRPDDQRVRVIALTDEASGNTLAARLLPFIGNDQSAVPGTTLVYKRGGFWVYELGTRASPQPRAN